MTAACRRALLAGLPAVGLILVLAHGDVPAANAQAPSGRSERVHEVQQGDTVSSIAGRYGVTVRSLVATNGLRTERARLRLGQRLTIPAAVAPAIVSATTTRREPAAPRRARGVATATRRPDNLVLALPDFQDACPPLAWPLEGAVSSNFGRRRIGWHRGIDILADPGKPIMAAAPGLVVASGVEPRYGWVVKIAHENGFVTVYAHNEQNIVDLGDWVQAGQMIGTVGRTGRATREHLHFEVRHEGLAYNPLYLLPLPPRIAQAEEHYLAEDDE